MKQIKYIDCFAAIEKWAAKDQDAPWSIEKMLADMERCQIHGALVYSNIAKEMQPSLGNNYVLQTCRENPRLIPCWVAMPHHCGDFPEPSKFVQEMVDNGVKAVKLFPKMHHYTFDERTSGKLLTALQEAEIPLLIDCGINLPELQQITWEDIPPLCSKYPALKIILHSMRWESTRMLLPLLQEFHNLHIEFSSYQANRIIELLVEKIGADQLLFGTDMMIKSPGAAKAFIDYADIDEEDRRKIAGGNLIRLLKLNTIPADYPDDKTQDVILQKVRRAEPIDDMELIDSHAHHMSKDQWDNIVVFMHRSDAAGIVERNKRIGVDITCVSSWLGVWSHYEAGNIVTRDAIAEFPQQIIGYATYDPRSVTDWTLELKRCYEEFKMKGMKPYFPRTQVPYNDPRYSAWFNYGNQYRLFALMHPSPNFEKEIIELASRYPEVMFLLAHTGMTWEAARLHVSLAKRLPNVVCEITYTAVTNGVIEYLTREIGSEKVIYGSDTAMRDPFPQFGWVAYADISENEKRNILGRNMRRIIDRCLLT